MGHDVTDKLFKSLDLTDEGFSFRKLLSLVILCLVVYLHIRFVGTANVLSAILYDFGFICVLLGLLNLDKFIDAKYGGLNTQSQLPFPNSNLPTNQPPNQALTNPLLPTQPIQPLVPVPAQVPSQPVPPIQIPTPGMDPTPTPNRNAAGMDPNDPNSEDTD